MSLLCPSASTVLRASSAMLHSNSALLSSSTTATVLPPTACLLSATAGLLSASTSLLSDILHASVPACLSFLSLPEEDASLASHEEKSRYWRLPSMHCCWPAEIFQGETTAVQLQVLLCQSSHLAVLPPFLHMFVLSTK